MCYLNRFDFQLSVPNKIVDFTRKSLRVLTGVEGELTRLLGPQDCLIPYTCGNADSLKAAIAREARH